MHAVGPDGRVNEDILRTRVCVLVSKKTFVGGLDAGVSLLRLHETLTRVCGVQLDTGT